MKFSVFSLPPTTPLLLSLADIKRLAEKEDWVVDNEGLTSLVGILLGHVGTFFCKCDEIGSCILQKLNT